MKIQLLHDTINFFLGKGQTGYYTPESLDILIHGESYKLFREYIDQYAATKTVSDFLSPFKRFLNLPVQGGLVKKPVDMEHVLGLAVDGVGPEILEEFQWWSRLRNPLREADADHPVILLDQENILVRPENAQRIAGWYWKAPAQPKYGYKIQNNRYTFDAASSSDIEWTEQMVPKLAIRVLAGLGINLRTQDVFAYSQQLKQEQI